MTAIDPCPFREGTHVRSAMTIAADGQPEEYAGVLLMTEPTWLEFAATLRRELTDKVVIIEAEGTRS